MQMAASELPEQGIDGSEVQKIEVQKMGQQRCRWQRQSCPSKASMAVKLRRLDNSDADGSVRVARARHRWQ